MLYILLEELISKKRLKSHWILSQKKMQKHVFHMFWWLHYKWLHKYSFKNCGLLFINFLFELCSLSFRFCYLFCFCLFCCWWFCFVFLFGFFVVYLFRVFLFVLFVFVFCFVCLFDWLINLYFKSWLGNTFTQHIDSNVEKHWAKFNQHWVKFVRFHIYCWLTA